jgi:Flp pilus assembly protein TadG
MATERRSLRGPLLRRHRNGQALVEFAIILPILLLLVGGIIQFGVLFWAQNTLTQVVRDTGRWAATQTSCSVATETPLIQAQADLIAGQSSLLGYQQGQFGPNVSVQWTPDDPVSPGSCPPVDNTKTWWINIGVQHRIPMFIPFLNYALPQCNASGCMLTTKTQFRMEPKPGP